MIREWLRRRREAKERIERDANELRLFMGIGGRYEALYRACQAERSIVPDRNEAQHWIRVGRRIAELENYVVGLKASDRYEIDARAARKRRRAF